jgi:TusA-related sulfurtransferase
MYAIDLRQTIIPFSFLKILNQFKRMRPTETMEIIGLEENSFSDLKQVLPAGTFEVTDIVPMEAGNPFFRLQLKKIKDCIKPSNQRRNVMSAIDLNTVEISSTVDARGSACPGPLLEAKKGIGKVKVGEVLEIYSNDSGTRTDIPAWSNKVGHEYLGVLEADGYDKHFVRRNK